VGEAFGLTFESSEFETIGGLIAHDMGHVPKRGEVWSKGGIRFVVLHTKGGWVKWFKVQPEDTAE
jgi:magnesium and cobalt transporter